MGRAHEASDEQGRLEARERTRLVHQVAAEVVRAASKLHG